MNTKHSSKSPQQVYNNTGWLGDGSHRGQGCEAWTAVGLPQQYPLLLSPSIALTQSESIYWWTRDFSRLNHLTLLWSQTVVISENCLRSTTNMFAFVFDKQVNLLQELFQPSQLYTNTAVSTCTPHYMYNNWCVCVASNKRIVFLLNNYYDAYTPWAIKNVPLYFGL